MANRDDTLKGLKSHLNDSCNACPYVYKDDCAIALTQDAFELLEPAKPIYRRPKYRTMMVRFCGYCGQELKDVWNACPACGKMVMRG